MKEKLESDTKYTKPLYRELNKKDGHKQIILLSDDEKKPPGIKEEDQEQKEIIEGKFAFAYDGTWENDKELDEE